MKNLIFTLFMSLMTFSAHAQNYHFDVNGNGTIDVTDAMLIIDYILGKLTPNEDDPPQSYLACPDDHHPHLIDLGLPSGTKWACCNVDTDHPENQSPANYGGYYAWGETETKSVYNDVTYLYCIGVDTDGDGKYDRNRQYQSLGSSICGTGYDVAHVQWGGSWQMPSLEDIEDLLDGCTSKWTTLNGIYGRQFTSKTTGGTIFLPASGYRHDSVLKFLVYYGFYWSGSAGPHVGNLSARYLNFLSDGANTDYGISRSDGFPVRPVSK